VAQSNSSKIKTAPKAKENFFLIGKFLNISTSFYRERQSSSMSPKTDKLSASINLSLTKTRRTMDNEEYIHSGFFLCA